MMSRQTWSSISVYDFFRTYNWTGKTADLEFLNSVEFGKKNQTSLSLQLKEFLLQSNWKGIKKKDVSVQSFSSFNEPLLTLSVSHFSKKIRWKKLPEIAPISNQSSQSFPDSKTSSNLDLNNLSDLF